MSNPIKSNMRHQFSQVPKAEIPRSSFDRSHNYKTTFNESYLIPFFVDEALPGDTFNVRVTTFARMSTPLHPIMDNIFCDVFFFACPLRLIWQNFPKFMGEQANPADSTSFLVPTATTPAGGYQNGSLQDYMGLPTAPQLGANTFTHANLHPRAYNLIYNQWFRDQNLQNSVVVDTGDGPDNVANYILLARGKRHDYFSSALPWPQKNNTGVAVTIPLGSSAPVITSGVAPTFAGVGTGTKSLSMANASAIPGWNSAAGATDSAVKFVTSGLMADLSSATAATINQLRQAFQIQRIYEKDARGGTRYTELIQAHFGVTSPDARLQRTEYLGGGSTPVNVNPIAQTGPTGTTGSTTPQGNLTGIGTFSHSGVGFTKSFTEHCVLIGLINIRADIGYQQGVNRMWTRSTRFDFFWPSLAQIGEQAVLNQEIYVQGTAADTAVFGYQERYAEYRYKPSFVTGQFRSSFATPLDSWHLALNFLSLPALNGTFIIDTPPISRVVAVSSQPRFLLDSYFSMNVTRPMPLYGVPGNIDRF